MYQWLRKWKSDQYETIENTFSQDKSNTNTKKTSFCEWRYSDVKE